MPKITICLTTYNRANYLRLAIESVLNQTYHDFELIVLDNASTANTEQIIMGLMITQKKCIRNERNIDGIENVIKSDSFANGEYFKYLHDDDTLKNNILEEVAN